MLQIATRFKQSNKDETITTTRTQNDARVAGQELTDDRRMLMKRGTVGEVESHASPNSEMVCASSLSLLCDVESSMNNFPTARLSETMYKEPD